MNECNVTAAGESLHRPEAKLWALWFLPNPVNAVGTWLTAEAEPKALKTNSRPHPDLWDQNLRAGLGVCTLDAQLLLRSRSTGRSNPL